MKNHADYAADEIFFTKWQIVLGVTLINVGRLESGSRWRVVEIITRGYGQVRGKSVNAMQKLSDSIYLENTRTHQRRVLTFATLSYSAISSGVLAITVVMLCRLLLRQRLNSFYGDVLCRNE